MKAPFPFPIEVIRLGRCPGNWLSFWVGNKITNWFSLS